MKTIEQIRNEIATMLGWKPRCDGSDWWDRDTTSKNYHPVPSDLGGVAAMMPEGWRTYYIGFQIETVEANAMNVETGRICKATASTELEARTRLLRAVLSAQAARTEVGRG